MTLSVAQTGHKIIEWWCD